jgi:hypothetical protein
MMDGANSAPHWKWVQLPDFRHPDHPEWDCIQWDLEDELVWNPRAVGRPVSGDPDDEFWFLLTKEAPGLEHLPHMVVLFRIASEPTDDQLGVIEGISAWEDDDDLVMTLLHRVQGRPSF